MTHKLAHLLRTVADRLDPLAVKQPAPDSFDINEIRELLASALAGLGLPQDMAARATSDELRTLSNIAHIAEGVRRCDWVSIEHGVWPQ